jgi:uncharacterized membrane protein
MPMMLVFLVLFVAAGFAAYSFIRRRGGHGFFDSEKKEEPLEIASRRYARGEISRQEFEQIKRDLEESRKE